MAASLKVGKSFAWIQHRLVVLQGLLGAFRERCCAALLVEPYRALSKRQVLREPSSRHPSPLKMQRQHPLLHSSLKLPTAIRCLAP